MSKPVRTGTVGGIPVTVDPDYVIGDGNLLPDFDGGVNVLGLSDDPEWKSSVAVRHIVLNPLPEPDPPRFTFAGPTTSGSYVIRDARDIIVTVWSGHPDARAAAERECARLNGDTPEPSCSTCGGERKEAPDADR